MVFYLLIDCWFNGWDEYLSLSELFAKPFPCRSCSLVKLLEFLSWCCLNISLFVHSGSNICEWYPKLKGTEIQINLESAAAGIETDLKQKSKFIAKGHWIISHSTVYTLICDILLQNVVIGYDLTLIDFCLGDVGRELDHGKWQDPSSTVSGFNHVAIQWVKLINRYPVRSAERGYPRYDEMYLSINPYHARYKFGWKIDSVKILLSNLLWSVPMRFCNVRFEAPWI